MATIILVIVEITIMTIEELDNNIGTPVLSMWFAIFAL